jgi:hypothetical protein
MKNYPLSFYLYLITKYFRQLFKILTGPMSGPAFALQAGLGAAVERRMLTAWVYNKFREFL